MTLPTDPQERKKLQLYTFMFHYFPDAWLEVVRIARIGNDQHNPGEPLHWAREKSTDQMNAAFNHIFDYGQGQRMDGDGGYHLARAVWRLMAQLQLDVEEAKRDKVEYYTPKPTAKVWEIVTGETAGERLSREGAAIRAEHTPVSPVAHEAVAMLQEVMRQRCEKDSESVNQAIDRLTATGQLTKSVDSPASVPSSYPVGHGHVQRPLLSPDQTQDRVNAAPIPLVTPHRP